VGSLAFGHLHDAKCLNAGSSARACLPCCEYRMHVSCGVQVAACSASVLWAICRFIRWHPHLMFVSSYLALSSTRDTTDTPQSAATCVCPDNKDSALSTAANILSILTFAYVFVLGVSYTLMVQWVGKGKLLEMRSKVPDLRERYQSLMESKHTRIKDAIGLAEVCKQIRNLVRLERLPLSRWENSAYAGRIEGLN
jgi:hypothetical protein